MKYTKLLQTINGGDDAIEALNIISIQILYLGPKRLTGLIIPKVVECFGLYGLLENVIE